MNLAEISIQKKVITWSLTFIVLLLGIQSYFNLSRLEDPEYAIKNAIIFTPYPGGTPEEVEKEVTDKIEKAVQQLAQIDKVESYSKSGMSIVKITTKDKYDKTQLPQIWDELRKKIRDSQKLLPPNAGPSNVMDDFGDVYGAYYALSGEEYTYADLKKVAEFLKRELLTVHDVKNIVFFGERSEAIYLEISNEKLSQLGLEKKAVYDAVQSRNSIVQTGRVKIGQDFVQIRPSGLFKSEKDFEDLLISSQKGKLIYLKDVATVKRDYIDPQTRILRYNSKKAIGIGISTALGGNAVEMGFNVDKRLDELKSLIPLGMEIEAISLQAESVTHSIDNFVINLIEAVLIVIVVLLIFMGLKSGLIIGFILILTISATFIVMDFYHISLDRISLGALIIALGMLVDNAIVIVDSMKVRIDAGMDSIEAGKEVISKNAMPLFGATAVAILAFASLGNMENSTGEFTRGLYYVILISLSLSWLTAVTSTPLLVHTFMKKKEKKNSKPEKEKKHLHDSFIYKFYKKNLIIAIRYRWITIAFVVAMFIAANISFNFVKKSFFPESTRTQFIVECTFRDGMHIKETEKRAAEIEAVIKKQKGVGMVASAIGGGHLRFMLMYGTPIYADSNYISMLIDVNSIEELNTFYYDLQKQFEQKYPDAVINVKKFLLGPSEGGQIQLRINGPNPDILRKMAEKAVQIMEEDSGTKTVHTEWGVKEKILQPQIIEDKARRIGLTRQQIAQSIQSYFEGTAIGGYREGTDILPIYIRAPFDERQNVENIKSIQISSPITGKSFPLSNIISDFKVVSDNPLISRWQRKSMIKVQCDPISELPIEVLTRIKHRIEQELEVDLKQYFGKKYTKEMEDNHNVMTIPIKYEDRLPIKGKPNYFISWGGSLEQAANSQAALAAYIPIFFGLMVLVVVILFNSIRQPLIIWLTVPLSLIGVTVGLLTLDQPFGFMALLGLMSLSGMLIKNAIVLIEEIDLEIEDGKAPFHAIVDSGLSRIRPVSMAALTTMLGMIPLFQDAFYVSMAVTIVFGLGFATLLTLVFVPVLYATFYGIRELKKG